MEITFNDLPQAITILNKKMDLIMEILESNSGNEIMNIQEAAKFIKSTENTVNNSKDMPKRYRGSRVFFLKKELLHWMLNEKEPEPVELKLTRNNRKAS